MIHIYYNQRRITLLGPEEEIDPKICSVRCCLNAKGIIKIFESFRHEEDQHQLCLRIKNPEKSLMKFRSYFQYIEAAGGLVSNPMGEYLFIYRLGKWDLPKGKIEHDEDPPEAAIREVTEECGISGLTITAELPPSYHIYPLDNTQLVLKKTFWYAMQSQNWQHTQAQTEEDIQKVEWRNPGAIADVLANTYHSLLDVIGLIGKI